MIHKEIVDELIWENQGKIYFAAGEKEVGKRDGIFLPLNHPLIEKEKQERGDG